MSITKVFAVIGLCRARRLRPIAWAVWREGVGLTLCGGSGKKAGKEEEGETRVSPTAPSGVDESCWTESLRVDCEFRLRLPASRHPPFPHGLSGAHGLLSGAVSNCWFARAFYFAFRERSGQCVLGLNAHEQRNRPATGFWGSFSQTVVDCGVCVWVHCIIRSLYVSWYLVWRTSDCQHLKWFKTGIISVEH